jgi:hypothetical protein
MTSASARPISASELILVEHTVVTGETEDEHTDRYAR